MFFYTLQINCAQISIHEHTAHFTLCTSASLCLLIDGFTPFVRTCEQAEHMHTYCAYGGCIQLNQWCVSWFSEYFLVTERRPYLLLLQLPVEEKHSFLACSLTCRPDNSFMYFSHFFFSHSSHRLLCSLIYSVIRLHLLLVSPFLFLPMPLLSTHVLPIPFFMFSPSFLLSPYLTQPSTSSVPPASPPVLFVVREWMSE